MKIITVSAVITVLLLGAGIARATGLTGNTTIKGQFLGSSLTMQSFLNKNLQVKQGESNLRDDIYEFNSKSPLKAFVFSLAVPGAGQFYTGSRIKAGTFFAIDAILWSGFLINHSKGSSTESDYKSYADEHYIASVYRDWWNIQDTSIQNKFSHRIYFDNTGSPIRTHEYYENIGKYDQFQVGWDDIGLNYPPPGVPGGTVVISAHRQTYLDMRKKANDYFSNATTFAMVSIANHIVSAFEAAIGARRYNRGTRQYSLQFESKNIDGKVAPFLVLQAQF